MSCQTVEQLEVGRVLVGQLLQKLFTHDILTRLVEIKHRKLHAIFGEKRRLGKLKMRSETRTSAEKSHMCLLRQFLLHVFEVAPPVVLQLADWSFAHDGVSNLEALEVLAH